MHALSRHFQRLLLALVGGDLLVQQIGQLQLREGLLIAAQQGDAFQRLVHPFVSVEQALGGHRQVFVVLFLDVLPSRDRRFHMASGKLDVAQDQAGAHAFAVGGERLLHVAARLLAIGFIQLALSQLAVELRHFMLEGVRVAAQLLGGGDGLVPIAVLLVDVQQLAARRQAHIAVLQLDQYFFRPVHQAGLAKILGQLETHRVAVLGRQIRRVQHALMQADGAVVLAALAVQFAQGVLQLQRRPLLASHFGQGRGRDIRLVLHQRVQAAEKAGRHRFRLFQHRAHVHARGKPTQAEKGRKQ